MSNTTTGKMHMLFADQESRAARSQWQWYHPDAGPDFPVESAGMLLCFTSRADAASRARRPGLLALLVTGDRREGAGERGRSHGHTRQTLDFWVFRRTDRS